MEKRLGFGATSGPAISVVKRVTRVLLVHISVCLGECGYNFKNIASELGGKRSRLSAWAGWESSGKI